MVVFMVVRRVTVRDLRKRWWRFWKECDEMLKDIEILWCGEGDVGGFQIFFLSIKPSEKYQCVRVYSEKIYPSFIVAFGSFKEGKNVFFLPWTPIGRVAYLCGPNFHFFSY